MNSKKMWHALIALSGYLILTAAITVGIAKLFTIWNCKWGVPFSIGCVIWVISLILTLILIEKNSIKESFALLLYPLNSIACGFLIAAYIIGKNDSVQFLSLVLMASLLACSYLLLMILFTIPSLKEKLWYQIVSYIIWFVGSIFLCVFLFNFLSTAFAIPIPQERDMLFIFFFIILFLLSIGTLFSTANFYELLSLMILPACIATFFIGVIILAALSGCDSCDCDCGDSCGESCDCNKGKHNATQYTEVRRSEPYTSFSDISDGNIRWL